MPWDYSSEKIIEFLAKLAHEYSQINSNLYIKLLTTVEYDYFFPEMQWTSHGGWTVD